MRYRCHYPNFIDEEVDTERSSNLPRVVELGLMLVICVNPCGTPKPGVAFISWWYYVSPAQVRSPKDSLCADDRCDRGLRSKKTQGNTAVNSSKLSPQLEMQKKKKNPF